MLMVEGIGKYSPLEHLKVLRHDFSDEIPDKILHSIVRIINTKLEEIGSQG